MTLGHYALSAKGQTAVSHWKILQNAKGATLFADKYFETVEDMINHYSQIDGLANDVRLTTPLQILQYEGGYEIDKSNIIKTKLLNSGAFSEVSSWACLSDEQMKDSSHWIRIKTDKFIVCSMVYTM